MVSALIEVDLVLYEFSHVGGLWGMLDWTVGSFRYKFGSGHYGLHTEIVQSCVILRAQQWIRHQHTNSWTVQR